jgi:hypothetical protein
MMLTVAAQDIAVRILEKMGSLLRRWASPQMLFSGKSLCVFDFLPSTPQYV